VDQLGNPLGGRIIGLKCGVVVEMRVVQLRADGLQLGTHDGEICEHVDFVEFCPFEIELDFPIMAVQGFERAIGKAELMGGAEFGGDEDLVCGQGTPSFAKGGCISSRRIDWYTLGRSVSQIFDC